MTLNLYRRHGSHCPGGRSLFTRTYEADELRRGWKKCSCPIYASGTLQGRFRRKNTECVDWSEAKALAALWEAAGAWSGSLKQAPVPAPPPPAVEVPACESTRMSIDAAIRSYLAIRESAGITVATLRKHRTFTKQLCKFADGRGYMMLDQFTATDIDVFYAHWKLGPRAKGHALGLLRGFFRFCANREWIVKSPVSADLKPPLGSSRVANKVPFTDDELRRILRACDRLEPVRWTNARGKGLWTGEDVKDFIWLLTYTGLRISDAAFFDIDYLRSNELFLRAKKNGGDVFTWVPNWLRDRLRQLSRQRGATPFVIGGSTRLETVTDLWRRKINKAFELAGEFAEPPTPHRFRHTFARILLERGVPVADVADLLGDNEETVRRHYARWVPERQARLTNILQEAFSDKPKPRVVALPDSWTA